MSEDKGAMPLLQLIMDNGQLIIKVKCCMGQNQNAS